MTDINNIKNMTNVNSKYDVEKYLQDTNTVNDTQKVNSIINPDGKISSKSASGTYLETNGSIDDETYKSIVKDLKNKIKEKKQDLSDTKKDRGFLTSIGNSISQVFGGGDSEKQKKIKKLEKKLNSLEEHPEKISSVYKSIMGTKLDSKAINSLKESTNLEKNLDSNSKNNIKKLLNSQCKDLEKEFEKTKNCNGIISGMWGHIKNATGIGASSNKTQTQLDNMKKELKSLDEHPENLAVAYKNITGRDLNNEELTKLEDGKISLKNSSKAAEKVKAYSDGQKMSTDVFADVVSGIIVIGAVAAAPFTGGASLLLAVGVGAATKVSIKAIDCIGNDKKYGLKDLVYDSVTGSINGLMAPLSGGLGGAVGTGVAKSLGLEAIESTAKTALTQTAKTAGKEMVEEGVEQIAKTTGKEVIEETLNEGTKKAGKGFIENILSKQGLKYVEKEGAEQTAKTFFAKGISYGTEMAVDGSLSGATDGFARAVGQGKLEDIPGNVINGTIGGLIAAPLIGGGFRITGKAGRNIKNQFFNKTETELSENISGNISKDISENITTPETASNFASIITKDGKEIILATSLEGRIAQLKELGIKTDYMADVAAKVDNKQYQRIVGLLDKGVDDYNAKNLAGLNDMQYQKCVDLLDKNIDVHNAKNIAELDDKQYQKCVDLLDKGFDVTKAKNIAELDDVQYQKITGLLDNGIDISSAKDIIALDAKQYEKITKLLDKDVDIYAAQNIAKLEDKQYQRITELLDKDIDVSRGNKIAKLDDKQYQRCLDLLDKKADPNILIQLSSLEDKQYQRCIELLNKKADSNNLIHLSGLDDKQYQRCLDLLDKKVNSNSLYHISGLDDKQYQRCLDLLDKGVDGYKAKDIAVLDDKQYQRRVDLLDKGVDDDIAGGMATANDEQYKKIVEVIDKGVNDNNIKKIAMLNEQQYKKCIELLDKKVKATDAYNLATLDEIKGQRYTDLINKDIESNSAKSIAKLENSQYQKCINLINKGVDAENALIIKDIEGAEYEKFNELINKNVGIDDPAAITMLNSKRYSQLLSLADEMKDVKIIDSDGKSRFFKCGELFKILNDDYCKTNIEKFISKGNIKIGELNKTIAAGKLTKNFALSGKEQDFINYANSIDYDKLSAAAPEVDKFTIDNFENLLDYHFKNGTSEFTEDSLKYNGELTNLLKEKLINATELSKVLSAFPNTNRNVGSLPKDWISNPSNETTAKIYNVIQDFTSLTKANKVNFKTSTNEIDNLTTEFSKILGKKVKAKYLGAGALGDAIKLEIDGAEPVVFKTFKAVPDEVRSDWKNIHGAGNEPQAGLFAKEHELTNFAEFYFGKVANSTDSDGFMVTKFLSNAEDASYPQTTADKLQLNYMVSTDDHAANLVDGKFIDYGAVKERPDVSPKLYDLAVNIVNKTMAYKNKLTTLENVNLNEYLSRLAKTPEIGEKDVLSALEFLNKNYELKMSTRLKYQLDEWIKKHNN